MEHMLLFAALLTLFLSHRLRKTARYLEQIISADKNPSIFSSKIGAIVYIVSELA